MYTNTYILVRTIYERRRIECALEGHKRGQVTTTKHWTYQVIKSVYNGQGSLAT